MEVKKSKFIHKKRKRTKKKENTKTQRAPQKKEPCTYYIHTERHTSNVEWLIDGRILQTGTYIDG